MLISSFPRCPVRRLTSRATQSLHHGGKNQVQRSCRLTNWNKVVKHSQNIQFYVCFISEFSWWNRNSTHFVLPAVERQKVKQRKQEREKKAFQCKKTSCHGHKSKSPKFYETYHPMSLHLYFLILFVVMQLRKLKAKGLWQSYWN